MFMMGVTGLIRKLLVAVDGSENGVRALDFALDLGEKYGAEVLILNVSESPGVVAVPQDLTAYAGSGMAAVAKDLSKIHEEILSKAVAHARSIKPNVPVKSRLREGDPALEIVTESREQAFDVVVIGHAGMGRVKEFLGLGGISEKVAHLAPCPVVIVR
jgi:nucleotide-binding universal stress UspA family protein